MQIYLYINGSFLGSS